MTNEIKENIQIICGFISAIGLLMFIPLFILSIVLNDTFWLTCGAIGVIVSIIFMRAMYDMDQTLEEEINHDKQKIHRH